MTLIFPIVGLSHFTDKISDLIARIEQFPSLQLMCDNGNPYSAYAIGVYWNYKQIGMVEDDYARIIRASLPGTTTMDAEFYTTDYESKKMFWAKMEMEQVAAWKNDIQLDLTPVLQMPWPKVGGEHTLLLQNTMDTCDEVRDYINELDENGKPRIFPEANLPQLAELCNQFANQYGLSLSGDDRRVEMTLDWLMEDVMNQWINIDQPTAYELYEPLCHLRDIHRHYANNPSRCARVYMEERKRVHTALVEALFLSDYQTILEAQHISIRQQQHVHEQWLMALPQNVFAFYKTDRNRFASKLFYLRLSWPQLLAVYVHLDCLELLYKLQGKRLATQRKSKSESAELNADKILYCEHYMQQDRLFIDGEIRTFLRKKTHRKTAELAFWIHAGERKHVFVPHMGGNAKQFVQAFCQEFNVKVDYSDLKKKYDSLAKKVKQSRETM